jgi:CRP-like cAMP-binding protein
VVESLARHALFVDVPADALAALDDAINVVEFGEGEWILRAGEENCGLHVIIDGDVGVVIDGEERARFHAGQFFGEISALLGEPVAADVFARTQLRCAVIDRDDLFPFLLANPSVTIRLLQAEVRRLADSNQWRA